MEVSRRPQRVAALVRAELAKLLIEVDFDGDLSQLVITEVQMSKDLRDALVFYSCGETPVKAIEAALEEATPQLRKRIGHNLKLRYVPKLTFKLDNHGDSVARVMQLLDELKEPVE